MIKIGRIQRCSEPIQQEIMCSLQIKTLFDFSVWTHSYMKHADSQRKRINPLDRWAHFCSDRKVSSWKCICSSANSANQTSDPTYTHTNLTKCLTLGHQRNCQPNFCPSSPLCSCSSCSCQVKGTSWSKYLKFTWIPSLDIVAKSANCWSNAKSFLCSTSKMHITHF